MSLKDEMECLFNRMYAYCMCIHIKNPNDTLNDCGFHTLLNKDEITIKGNSEEYRLTCEELDSILKVESVKILKDKAYEMFNRNDDNELIPMQMATVAEFITAMEKSHFSSAIDEGFMTHQYVRDIKGNMFNLYESKCGTASILRITSGYGDKALNRYILILGKDVLAYAIDTDVDEAVKLCEEAQIPSCT